jgi:hypothetical protein
MVFILGVLKSSASSTPASATSSTRSSTPGPRRRRRSASSRTSATSSSSRNPNPPSPSGRPTDGHNRPRAAATLGPGAVGAGGFPGQRPQHLTWTTFARPRRAQTRHHGRHIVFASRAGDLPAGTARLTLPFRPVPQNRNSYQSVRGTGRCQESGETEAARREPGIVVSGLRPDREVKCRVGRRDPSQTPHLAAGGVASGPGRASLRAGPRMPIGPEIVPRRTPARPLVTRTRHRKSRMFALIAPQEEPAARHGA